MTEWGGRSASSLVRSRAGGELEDASAVAHGVVAADDALCVEAQDVVDLVGPEQRHEGRALKLGRDREAAVVVGQVGVLDEAVGGLDGGDAGEVEFLDQAVLEGAEGALRATPRLGGVGGDAPRAAAPWRPGPPAAGRSWSRSSSR